MLEGIARGLPAAGARRAPLERMAERHREAGLAGITGAYYAGSHWHGTRARYPARERGLEASPRKE